MLDFFKSKKTTTPMLPTSTQSAPKPTHAPKALNTPIATQPSSGLRHDAQLVSILIQEHEQLLHSFTDISDTVKQNQWNLVEQKLKYFKEHLVDHLVKEGIKLYAYGTVACKSDLDLLNIFNGFKIEMSGIGSVVFNFIDVWCKPDALKSAEAKLQFSTELVDIGNALVARIRREEATLYPLYDSLRDLRLTID